MTPSSRVLVYSQCKQPAPLTKIGLLKTQSIGNKYTVVADCITSNSFNFFAAVETWHESADCPIMIACMLGGYRCIKQARSRSAKNATNTKTNHGGVFSIRHVTTYGDWSCWSTRRSSCCMLTCKERRRTLRSSSCIDRVRLQQKQLLSTTSPISLNV